MPPVPGEPPAKVVFDGVEPGSPEAQRLYFQNAGVINHFHAAARQSREISEQPRASRLKALPGGGQLRYTYNNGQEIIHVRLNPVPASNFVDVPPPPRPPDVLDPLLAIDVLFTNESFMAGDIFVRTSESTVEREWLWEEGDPIPVDPDDPALAREDSTVLSRLGEPWEGHYTLVSTVVLAATGYAFNGFFTATAVADSYNYPVTNDSFNIATYQLIETIDTSGPFSDFIGFGAEPPYTQIYVLIQELSWSRGGPGDPVPNWIGRLGPPIEGEESNNTRDQVSFFDVLNVVGLRVEDDPADPNDEAYEAISIAPSEDSRLLPLEFQPSTLAASRALVMADTPPPGFVGEGFLARPKRGVVPGDPAPVPTEIKVYISSTNITKANTYPGALNATFEADDPSFTYDVKDTLAWTIRAREFVAESPVVVEVTTETERRDKHWTALAPDTEPTIEGDPVDSLGRTVTWNFAAGAQWADQGGEPADASVPSMGVLLDELSGSSTGVVGPTPLGRTIRETPEWDGDVSDMTHIATIIWTPPSKVTDHGTAQITPA